MPFFAKVRVQNFLREMDENVLLLYERPHELHLFWESNGHNQLLLIKLPCYAGYIRGRCLSRRLLWFKPLTVWMILVWPVIPKHWLPIAVCDNAMIVTWLFSSERFDHVRFDIILFVGRPAGNLCTQHRFSHCIITLRWMASVFRPDYYIHQNHRRRARE